MANHTTVYDEVPYPGTVHPTTHPSHLAALARLHGLAAPDPATARVLEVGGGDGCNLLGMAVAYPRASYLGFDLSAGAVARGQALARAAGLENVRIEQGDVIATAATMDAAFDYVIVNGLYAWVPEVVRAATMALIGRVLAPEGIAFLSYNATPGGHLRMAIREMLLRETRQAKDAAGAIAQARAFLADFAAPSDDDADSAAHSGLRFAARPMLDKSDGFLFHDELGEHYEPQGLTEVAEAAAKHGLAWLNDASPALVFSGLPGTEMDEAAALHFAQAEDYRHCAFFHRSVFVRSGRRPLRRIEPTCFADLFAASRARRTGPQSFRSGESEIEIDDDRLCDFLGLLAQAAPVRLPLAEFADSPSHCDALVELYQRDVLDLHAAPYPGTIEPGERPLASAVVRAQIAAGAAHLFTLEHRSTAINDPAPRAFLALLDGTRDRARIAADWAASGFAGEIGPDDALRQLCAAGLVVA